jgi:hypothetical protein
MPKERESKIRKYYIKETSGLKGLVNTVHNKRLNKQSVMQTDAGDSQHSLN